MDMKERYGEDFTLSEWEVKNLYCLLDTLDIFLSRYREYLFNMDGRDEKQETILIGWRLQINAMQRRIIDWLELNTKSNKVNNNGN